MSRNINADSIKAMAALNGIELTDTEAKELLPQTVGLADGLDDLVNHGMTMAEPAIVFTPESE